MKRTLWHALLIGLLLVPATAYGAAYREFTPDYAQSLLVASSGTVDEVFLPLNEYLAGFDFWLSNGGIATDAVFQLYNSANTLLGTASLTVPPIADSETGTRVHVSLPSQVAVVGQNAYRVRISSSAPTLRMYYATANTLLTHNGVPLPVYTGGLARISGEDRAYSFKFALYENREASPPVISSVTVTQTELSHVLVSYYANEPVDRSIAYGETTEDWTSQYTSCLITTQPCTALLPVAPGTTYSYTLTVQDVWGNSTAYNGSFTTLESGQTPTPTPTPVGATPTPTQAPTPTPDTTPPTISNARVVSMTPNSATFAWTTSEAASSIVVVQLVPEYINAGSNFDQTLELEHYITVGSLPTDTHLRASITSNDTSGNSAKATINFLTPQSTPTPTPAPTPATSPGAPTPTPTSTATPTPSSTPVVEILNGDTLSWPTPSSTPATQYRIDVFDAQNNLIRSVVVSGDINTLDVTNLPEGEHRIVVYADRDGAFEKIAAPATITVQHPTLTKRVLSNLPSILMGTLLIGSTLFVIQRLRTRAHVGATVAQPPTPQVSVPLESPPTP